ncbi:MAG: PfkB family carbohydrate kinase, partial [Clostridia bacterium]
GSFVVDNVATMDRFPSEGETVLGNRLQIFLGGKGANQCVSAQRLGAKTSMIGMLGKDNNGLQFRDIFI